MSWATCYTGSNNIHKDEPPLMMDGRNYSSWQPESVINNRIQTKEGIRTNWEYRQFLQNNGNDIMKYNHEEYCYYLGIDANIAVSDDNAQTKGNEPYTFKSVHDTKIPSYGYCKSDLKNPYLTREQLNARILSPAINQSALNIDNATNNT